jgi:hypothetical protein
MTPDNADRRMIYERVCESYHAIDDFRLKLLGSLPLATGAGVLILVRGEIKLGDETATSAKEFLAAIGLFGLVITLGLFAYELHGIKKCHYLIRAGQYLEEEIGVHGQFSSRPHDVGGKRLRINEPFASSIIYPASLGAWAFTGVVLTSPTAAAIVGGAITVLGFVVARWTMGRMATIADEHMMTSEGWLPAAPARRRDAATQV